MGQAGVFQRMDAVDDLGRGADHGYHVGQFRHDEVALVLARVDDVALVQREVARPCGQAGGIRLVPLHPCGDRGNRR